jgi:hypothetical protein
MKGNTMNNLISLNSQSVKYNRELWNIVEEIVA